MPYYFKINRLFLLPVLLILLAGCSSTQKQLRPSGSEVVSMNVKEDPDFYNRLSGVQTRGAARGVLLPFTGNAVSMAKDAFLNLIEKEEQRLTKTYKQGQSDLFFYNTVSENHALDPSGMQFDGLSVSRVRAGREDRPDTTFHAKFSVDTSNEIEILNNSIFRLKIDELRVNDTELPGTVRWFMPWTWFDKPSETINLDVNIKIFASWIDENMNMKRIEPVGEFFLVLRNVPLKGADNYQQYISSVEGAQLAGYSYMVPRSVSFQKVGDEVAKIYGHGLYSMEVEIVESRHRGKVATTTTEIIEKSDLLR